MAETATLRRARESISELGEEMLAQGLTAGTGGNISASDDDGHMAISPTGMPYREISPENVPVLDASNEVVEGNREPSSETRMHRMLHEREDVGGVVHTHSPYASAFACAAEPIPPSHYLIAYIGKEVPVADYATYGTEELGERAAATIGTDYNACLLQNHGVIAVGADPDAAFEVALMVEYCARSHYITCQVGEPQYISDEELEHLFERFEDYGQNR